jgi:hypothetical protein
MTDNDKMNDTLEDAGLEDFFEAARATPPSVPQALMARVQADALDAQPRAKGMAKAGWLQALGGLPGLGGLATAACVGVWIGIAPPAQLPDLGGLALGLEDISQTDVAGFGWDIGTEEG